MSIKVTKCGLCGQSTDNPECHNCPNETMENKIHSYNLLNSKFEIAKKEIHKHLQSISNWMRVTDERLEELSDHEERITDIENISAEKRLLDLNREIQKLRGAYLADSEAIKALIFDGARDKERLDSQKERIEKLEQEKVIYKQHTIDSIHARLNILEQMHAENIYKPIESSKKPHKCPVCDGKGTPVTDDRTCISCDDSGVIWG